MLSARTAIFIFLLISARGTAEETIMLTKLLKCKPLKVYAGAYRSAISTNKESMCSTNHDSSTSSSLSSGNGTLMTQLKYHPGKWDIWMLGMTIVIGGQYFSWNAGLSAGLYSYLIAYFLIAGAYITLCFCTSEISGALPFAGGAYGLSRCTLGFYPAFLIGCCEAIEYIIYVSTSVISFANMIFFAVPSLHALKPAVWLLFYLSALFIHIKGDRVFWISNAVLSMMSVAVVLLFFFGSLPYVSFSKYADDPQMQVIDGFSGFMKSLPLASWFFVGVEALSLSSDQVPRPKVTVPFAQVACVLTLFISGITIFFVAVSLPPGLANLPTELVPFNSCFILLFKLSRNTATIFSLPATYATAFGFMWCYGKLIAAMATSRLLPHSLSKTTQHTTTPYMALLGGSAISYGFCMLVYWVPSIGGYLFNICITCAFMSYTGQCIGYISLKVNYRNIKSSTFRNPCGIAGAIFSMSVWLLGIVSIAVYQRNNGIEILSFLGLVALLSLYYFTYARKRQTFSTQENKVLLVAHVTKFNGKRAAAARASAASKNKSANKEKSGNHTVGTDTSQADPHASMKSTKNHTIARSSS